MQKSMSWFGLVFRAILLLVVFCLVNGMISSRNTELEAQETELSVVLSGLRDDNLAVRQEIGEVGSDFYVESKARAEYQFIKPGELSFSFSNPQALYEDSAEESAIRMTLTK